MKNEVECHCQNNIFCILYSKKSGPPGRGHGVFTNPSTCSQSSGTEDCFKIRNNEFYVKIYFFCFYLITVVWYEFIHIIISAVGGGYEKGVYSAVTVLFDLKFMYQRIDEFVCFNVDKIFDNFFLNKNKNALKMFRYSVVRP